MIRFHESIDKLTRIKVMGVGGGGCNAVDRMILSGLDAVEYVCVNTDLQALVANKPFEKVQIGPKRTRGLGAGGDPQIGKESAEESIEELKEVMTDCDILFLMGGFGGGTGTGAIPVIAQLAKEMDILTVPVVTKPFNFEGRKRAQLAQAGVRELLDHDISIVTVPNEKLLSVVTKNTSVTDAFLMTDRYLMACVESLHGLLTMPGLINVDFADVRTVMSHRGLAVIGQGTGEGQEKVSEAVQNALNSPLLEKESLAGSKGVLIHVSGGRDVSLIEVNQALTKVEEMVHAEANIIFGASVDEKAQNKAHVTIIATGLDEVIVELRPSATGRTEQTGTAQKEKPKIETKLNQKPEKKPEIKPEPKPEVEPEPEPGVEPPPGPEIKPEPGPGPEKPTEPGPEVEPEPSPEVKPGSGTRSSRKSPSSKSKQKQIVLNFSPGQKGRFEKMEPTLYDGEDLDIPTFIRRKKLFEETTEEEVS